jgi:hypothetical protein
MIKKKQKILSIGMVVLLATTFFFAAPKKSQALIPVIDLKLIFEEVLRGIIQGVLTHQAHSYTEKFVNQVQDKYKISDYLTYSKNIIESVYTVKALSERTKMDAFILKVNLSKQNGTDGGKSPDLTKLYNKQTLDYINYGDFLKGGAKAELAYERLTDPLYATPQGQKAFAENTSAKVLADAQQAAGANLAVSSGKKDLFECKDVKGASGINIPKCIVSKPAQYVNSQIDSKIQSLFGEQLKPQNQVVSMLLLFGQTVAKKLGDSLLGGGKGTNLVGDTTALAPSNPFGNVNDYVGSDGGGGGGAGGNSGSVPADPTANTPNDITSCLPNGISLGDPVFGTGQSLEQNLRARNAGCFQNTNSDGSTEGGMFDNLTANNPDASPLLHFYHLVCINPGLTDKSLIEANQQARSASIRQAQSLDSSYIILDCR